jgi:hypothetical protein
MIMTGVGVRVFMFMVMMMIVVGTVGMIMVMIVISAFGVVMVVIVVLDMLVFMSGMTAIVIERVRASQGLGHECHCANHNDNDDCYPPPKNVSVKCLLKNILQ